MYYGNWESIFTLWIYLSAVGHNHWSELCCAGSVCLSGKSWAWAGWTQCGCSSDTVPVKRKTIYMCISSQDLNYWCLLSLVLWRWAGRWGRRKTWGCCGLSWHCASYWTALVDTDQQSWDGKTKSLLFFILSSFWTCYLPALPSNYLMEQDSRVR